MESGQLSVPGIRNGMLCSADSTRGNGWKHDLGQIVSAEAALTSRAIWKQVRIRPLLTGFVRVGVLFQAGLVSYTTYRLSPKTCLSRGELSQHQDREVEHDRYGTRSAVPGCFGMRPQ